MKTEKEKAQSEPISEDMKKERKTADNERTGEGDEKDPVPEAVAPAWKALEACFFVPPFNHRL